MAKPATRITAIQALMALSALAIFGRAFVVQVIEQKAWQKKADQTRTAMVPEEARRGTIYDRNGVPLAVTQERFRLRLTRNQLADIPKVQQLLVAVGYSQDKIAREFRKDYPYFSTPLSAEEMEPFRRLKGVYTESLWRRVYPLQRLAAPWLGTLDADGRATGGIESAFDTALTGVPGEAQYLVDGHGLQRKVPRSQLRAPVPGHDLYLTLDHELQGIAEAELLDAVETLPAQGGDVVMLDAHTGEVLAIASLRRDGLGRIVPTTSAMVEPIEPGSTAKIFTAAALLRNGADTSAVPGHGGSWSVPGIKRVIKDVHAEGGMLTLGETIKVSSNIGISQFALRLQPEQQFRALRDFGFGTSPVTGLPADEGELHRPPWANDIFSMTSLAQGYEFSGTALQIASAYGAIGNGGTLMAASIVREAREDGRAAPLWKHEPTPIRRIITPEIASRLRDYLRLATDSGGSGAKAQLDYLSVIGKTATAKIRPYRPGDYRAGFAGLFPGDDPQLVVYIMIDRPSGNEFYGGAVAAPLVQHMLYQALAVQSSPLDRRRLEGAVSHPQVAQAPRLASPDSVRAVRLPLKASAGVDSGSVAVPPVTGLSPRAAAASLHRAGLRVNLTGTGQVSMSSPEAGAVVPRGTTISLQTTSRP